MTKLKLNLTDIVATVAPANGLNRKACYKIAKALFAEIAHQLEQGNDIGIVGFATFKRTLSSRSKCYNFQTGRTEKMTKFYKPKVVFSGVLARKFRMAGVGADELKHQ